MNMSKHLELLRNEMKTYHCDLYLVPSIDAHNSEYLPECWQRRAWISGFNGSAGEALITQNHAYLSTDGRYFLQATLELNNTDYTLLKQNAYSSEVEGWLNTNAVGMCLGVDPSVISVNRACALKTQMGNLGGKLNFIQQNLVDLAMSKAACSINLPGNPVFLLDDNYTGLSTAMKLKQIKDWLNTNSLDCLALNVLDEIAWCFNLRGSDIKFNPLSIAYALISKTGSILFIDYAKLTPKIVDSLAVSQVEIKPYAEFMEYLTKIKLSVAIDPKTANYAMFEALSNANVHLLTSPVVLQKAIKNPQEQEGARIAHQKDAVAVINFLTWLEKNWQSQISEEVAQEYLANFRAEQEHNMGSSFDTISAYAENGAVIHYRANSQTAKIISNDNLYLLDSGGQYLEGTTDITRTIHLGTPSLEQKRHYTLVLKGHLALARTVFPAGTCGEHLDAFARSFLWQEHLNYRHGTGHGVGSFLCVHEGPQRISGAISNIALTDGMIVSNEPGFYLEGGYGIRIENLCLVVLDNAKPQNGEYGQFYTFEDLTLVPYSKKLIDKELLTTIEIKQINDYYAKIRNKLMPVLSIDVAKWLDQELNW